MGRKICGTATSFGPACYNGTCIMRKICFKQMRASTRIVRSHMSHIYQNCISSTGNEKQVTAGNEMFGECNPNECMYRASHLPKWKLAVTKRKNPKPKVQGTTKQRPTWTIWESEKESRHRAAQIELEGEQTKDHAMQVVDVQLKANEMVEAGVRAIC